MSQLLLNYSFNTLSFSNPDGSHAAAFSGGNIVPGPGSTGLGRLSKGIALGTAGKASVPLRDVATNARQFCVRISFRVSTPVTKRQNLAESTRLPFSISLQPGKSAVTYDLMASVGTKVHGWSGCSTLHRKTLTVGRWYTATMAYDLDTMALFINGRLIDIHAFPKGTIEQKAEGRLFLGTWVDGRRNKFSGSLAGFQLYSGIPAALEAKLDAKRDSPAWYITHKYEEVKKAIRPGKLTAKPGRSSAVGTTYFYERCGILYHPDAGGAFAIKGSIYTKYKTMRGRSSLGYLVTDESNGTLRGVKKSLFQKGGIYWTRATGSIPVTGRIYLEYENQGGSRKWGAPTGVARREGSGLVQVFQKCRFYHENNAPRAFEVHGQILRRYLALGGPRKFGYPVSDEMDIRKGGRVIGKVSDFTGCTIYWSRQTNAFEVHGDIRKKYQDECGGPTGELGLPTSNETAIPGMDGGPKMNSFQKGSILWYNGWNHMVVARPTKLFINRIETKESEGVFMGQNDLHFYASIHHGSRRVYHVRKPGSGSYGDRNHREIDFTVPVTMMPNTVGTTYKFTIDIRDSDPGNDDHLGKKTWTFNAANAWGMRNNQGVYDERFSKVKSLTFSIKPQVNIRALTQVQRFWGIRNQRTPIITRDQYASMFRDVDSETEWWDILDGLRTLYYKLAVKGVAAGGNCFGFSLEAIQARKNRSLFGMPIERFDSWPQIKNEINIKQGYQLGASSIWWTVGQFLSGNTHDPVDVFRRSRSAFRRGENPILGISQDYFYTEGGHAILPVAWDDSGREWTIDVMDSNDPRNVRKLFIDPRKNEYRYQGSTRLYRGSEWAGGRLLYFPYCLYNTTPRTPMWEAIAIFLAGGFLLLGDDTETTGIVDKSGRDLLATGERAKRALKAKTSVKEYFLPIQPTDGAGLNKGQFLARREGGLPDTSFVHSIKGLRRNGNLEYFLKDQLREVNLTSQINANEVNKVNYQDRNTVQNVLAVTSPRAKDASVEYRNKLGVAGDYFQVKVEGMKLKANTDLKLNLKPSFGGLEIDSAGQRVTVPVKIETRINNQIKRKTIEVDLRQPLRIMPTSIGGTPQLAVSRLDSLFGPKLDLDIR